MTAWRALRIAVVACLFSLLFVVSQRITAMRDGHTTPGIEWTVGMLALILLAGAFAAEWTRAPVSKLRKDLLWGVGAGGLLSVLSRF